MIVANKFQTGFDQPKLCAMYIDKKLQGVACVQTLSRLNRTFGDSKQTFIIDFANEAEEILAAFKPYYNKAELSGVTDPQQIYDLQRKLDDQGIYHWEEVQAFARAFFDPKAAASELSYYCQPAVDRFTKRYEEAQAERQQAAEDKKRAQAAGDTVGINHAEYALKEAGERIDALHVFRKDLLSFVRVYEFVSQIVRYDDLELEQLCVFARHLHGRLRIDRLREDLDPGELRLTHYRLNKQAEQRLRLDEFDGDETLQPGSGVGTGLARDPKMEQLSQIIKALNEVFGSEIHDEDQLHYARGYMNRLGREQKVVTQIENETIEQIMLGGEFHKRIRDMVLDDMAEHEKLAMEILGSEAKLRTFTRAVATLMKNESALA